jgi:hypothetical protein
MSEQFSNPEQALIERLRRAPQPELSVEVREMIHARVLEALDHPPVPAPRPALPRPMVMIIIVLVAAALIAGGILFLLSRQPQPDITPTIPAIVTTLPSTVTPSMTLTATVLPTATALTFTPTAVPAANVGTIIVVEGPVEKIDGNVITIYGTQIQIPPNDPILSNISVGDVLHVEGDSQAGTTQIVIVATTVVVVNVDVNVNSSSGEVWRDDGNCSHPPPDWAPANGWRRRCEGKDKEKDKGEKHDKGDDDHND